MVNPDDLGPYQYTNLLTEKDEIRLLILHPGSFDDPVQGDVRTVALSDPLQFTALSYTWGDPTKTTPIFLEGHTVEVTVNLKDALLHLRHSTEDRTLWIR